MDKCLIGIYHLFEVEWLIGIMRECRILEEILIQFHDSIRIRSLVTGDNLCAEDASCEVATIRNEVDSDAICIISLVESIDGTWCRRRSEVVQGLAYLVQMLVGEEFIDREIIVSP